ncbi:hypothetical protein FGG08_000679 [Glutinoglossum americanum]|uniref:Uncharacterized protein n=1 Tax=Glutinoglossum americanum TaxID=1670608 RepID=A0A9P8ICQ8_9PEZI|nr:hypothetical protein FGG08_000679 [Glutinoglossum americanum]
MRERPSRQQLSTHCHGQRCSCALKKEHLDPVPEFDDSTDIAAAANNDSRKPKLTSAQSEGSLTVFSNGHHKPAHKHNHLAHNCAPYKIPKPHSIHGSSDIARRSVDSLPATNAVEGGLSASPISDSIISAQQEVRLIKSEHTSPEMRATSNFDHQNGQLQPLDLSFSEFSASQIDSCATYDYWSPDTDGPIYSAGLSMPSSDWSAIDLPLDGNAFDTSVHPPYGFDYNSLVQPALTNSSSGEPSEVDDFIPVSDAVSYGPPSLVHNSDSSESYEGGETESYRLSTTSSFMGLQQAQVSMLSSSNVESLDIDEFLKGAAAGTATFAGSDIGGEPSNNEAVGANNYRFNETKKWAVDDQTDDIGLNLPLTANDTDNLWLTQLNQGATLGPEEDVPESVWGS